MLDKTEARLVLEAKLAEYQLKPYDELVTLLERPTTFEVLGPSGTQYQLEVQAVWDDHLGGNVRVMCAIDDGGWRACFPVCGDFIVSPTGEFVGE